MGPAGWRSSRPPPAGWPWPARSSPRTSLGAAARTSGSPPHHYIPDPRRGSWCSSSPGWNRTSPPGPTTSPTTSGWTGRRWVAPLSWAGTDWACTPSAACWTLPCAGSVSHRISSPGTASANGTRWPRPVSIRARPSRSSSARSTRPRWRFPAWCSPRWAAAPNGPQGSSAVSNRWWSRTTTARTSRSSAVGPPQWRPCWNACAPAGSPGRCCRSGPGFTRRCSPRTWAGSGASSTACRCGRRGARSGRRPPLRRTRTNPTGFASSPLATCSNRCGSGH